MDGEKVFDLLVKLVQNGTTNINYKRKLFISILMICEDEMIVNMKTIFELLFHNLFSRNNLHINVNIDEDYNSFARQLYLKLMHKREKSIRCPNPKIDINVKEIEEGYAADPLFSILELNISNDNEIMKKAIVAHNNNCFIIDSKKQIKGFSFCNGNIQELKFDIHSNICPSTIDAKENFLIVSSKCDELRLLRQNEDSSDFYSSISKLSTGYENNILKISDYMQLFGSSSISMSGDIIQIFNFEQLFPNRIIKTYSKIQDFAFLDENVLISIDYHNMSLWDMRSPNSFCSFSHNLKKATEVMHLCSNKISITTSYGSHMFYDIRNPRDAYITLENNDNSRFLSKSFAKDTSYLSIIYDKRIEIYDAKLDKVFENEINLFNYTTLVSNFNSTFLRIM